jgi:ABC-type transport system involved in cytochrome c biogenesis permease component
MPNVAIGVPLTVLFSLAYLVCGIESVAITLIVITLFACAMAVPLYGPAWIAGTMRELRRRLDLPPLHRSRQGRARRGV